MTFPANVRRVLSTREVVYGANVSNPTVRRWAMKHGCPALWAGCWFAFDARELREWAESTAILKPDQRRRLLAFLEKRTGRA